MDRRSWLWRRKSSEKSPSAETDSSGSISSHSERFSDDQALSNHNGQSPEVISEAARSIEEVTPSIEDLRDSVKTLSRKLTEALVNIGAKEALVKQHAKVAEEAVSGWEKAEAEVLVLKRQIDVTTQKNLALEERVVNLDSALKECLRQLRQTKEEQEQRIHVAVAKKSAECESTKSELETQLANLQGQLETAKTDAVTSTFPDLCIKLEAVEKENSILKLQLISRDEELKLRTSERDLSTHVAETASKQHLECIKKVAKLEAECRRLKMQARKAATVNDQRSFTASSVYVESFTDSQSDCGERLSLIENESCKMGGLETYDNEPGASDLLVSSSTAELDQFKNEKSIGRNLMVSSDEKHLMNDFIEMERLAALPDAEERSGPDSGSHHGENLLKSELKAMVNQTAELEEKLEKMAQEKVELNMSLNECQQQLHASRDQMEGKEIELTELKIQLVTANDARRTLEAELQATKNMLDKLSGKLIKAESSLMEGKAQLSTVKEEKLEAVIDLKATSEKLLKVTKSIAEEKAKVAELSIQLANANESSCKIQSELEAAKAKKDASESRLKVAELEIENLESRVNKLEENIREERLLCAEAVEKCQKLNCEISKMKSDSQLWQAANIGEFKANQDKELAMAASKFAECQKTIASLGQQLNYLATLEDIFLIDSEKRTEMY